ncbi:DUF4148 domain-containing protein [Caldimonas brevitalea]|uniref:DUF4148 domain-containing protein n=1 Tax=Caldimonas brevitalea TaxID=413882 RepID=A0A0G3BU13_9BURK|nr:DUF4148 domain-containing protein [Caldimonas brevitalea]AKJ30846.1 hypothetical protein AAW51_4155 [Caldimonas brevitalea]
MNVQKKLIVAVMTTFAAAGAFAQEATPEDDNFHAKYASVKTRAEVKAELAQARAQGQLAVFSGEASVFPEATSRTAFAGRREDSRFTASPVAGKTRAEVKAELAEARAASVLPVFSGEASVFPEQGRTATARNREDAKREQIGG